ncbi:hypothetical protein V495_04622 [Pseudogymnoascus sp. VKM F-4514 (FW-929)]|nr:hypothetical protein V490_05292 [Pseudogymnoascus sp. VKM F-3557]KFY42229.1 hypothetical protein V495_04622 [Pseudogymnoascus sp. VKM F-4514 (FW-929)]KFY59122.1 hypothetical protein V497_04506 [Pseudogymnoascus sp. VKM F-4516 (FW-969)]
MRLLSTTLAVIAAVPFALGFTADPSVDPLPDHSIFSRQTFYETHFCYPDSKLAALLPGKTADVNKLVALVKEETNDILMVHQGCTIFTCYNNIGVRICNFDSKDIVITALKLTEEINELTAKCNDGGLTAGIKSSSTGYTVSVGSIESLKPGWSCS